nr:L,D-transpeptidase [Bacillus massiliglaciei]
MKGPLALVLVLFLFFGISAAPAASADEEVFLIVNKANNQLAVAENGKILEIVSAGTGKSNEDTPEGAFTIKVKAVNPYYRNRDIEGGDPANPLGTRWIGFDAEETDGRRYGIHGTNRPESIGKYMSNGCIRLLNEDVERIYEMVPVGGRVFILSSDKSFAALAKDLSNVQ